MPRGGSRPGSGRKPLPPGQKKRPATFKLKPAILAYLRSQKNATKTLEAAIERSRDYRAWRKDSAKSQP